MSEVLDFDRRVGDVEGIANDLGLLAIAAAQLEEDADALRFLRESAAFAGTLGHRQVLANRVLLAASLMLQRMGDAIRAIECLAAARAVSDVRGTGLGPLGEAVFQNVWSAAASALEPGAAAGAAERGARMVSDSKLDSFVDEILRDLD